jgi:hypothetical protein
MKNKFLFLSILTLSTSFIKAQTLKTKVITPDTTVTGFLSAITDTSIQLSVNSVKFRQSILNKNADKNYNYQKIESISIIKKGTIIKSILIGTVVGILIGYADSKSDYGPGARAYLGGVSGIFCGLVVGLISYNKTFNIYRKIENFKKLKTSILKMTRNVK